MVIKILAILLLFALTFADTPFEPFYYPSACHKALKSSEGSGVNHVVRTVAAAVEPFNVTTDATYDVRFILHPPPTPSTIPTIFLIFPDYELDNDFYPAHHGSFFTAAESLGAHLVLVENRVYTSTSTSTTVSTPEVAADGVAVLQVLRRELGAGTRVVVGGFGVGGMAAAALASGYPHLGVAGLVTFNTPFRLLPEIRAFDKTINNLNHHDTKNNTCGDTVKSAFMLAATSLITSDKNALTFANALNLKKAPTQHSADAYIAAYSLAAFVHTLAGASATQHSSFCDLFEGAETILDAGRVLAMNSPPAKKTSALEALATTSPAYKHLYMQCTGTASFITTPVHSYQFFSDSICNRLFAKLGAKNWPSADMIKTAEFDGYAATPALHFEGRRSPHSQLRHPSTQLVEGGACAGAAESSGEVVQKIVDFVKQRI